MNFCSHCGSDQLEFRIPSGDNRARYICSGCGMIHYQNPKIVVGCLPFYEGKLLLCKRDIEPQKGFWNLPAGFMENGETVEEGAMREVLEEAQAKVELDRLFAVFNIIHVNQVYLLFLANMTSDTFGAGDETAAAQLFSLDEIPFDQLAFNSNKFAIQKYLDNPHAKQVHIGSYNRTF
jgi:ADP-ribose pyrophosphatase YjhB (NUDIX family)